MFVNGLGLLVFAWCILEGGAIKCYECFLAERPYYFDEQTQVKTCNDFDYSAAYVGDCPESTFCFKKTVKDFFYKTEYVREERGCAKQLYRGQKFNFDLGWIIDSYVVPNAYQSGCKTIIGSRTPNVADCYCDGFDLCNSGSRIACGFLFVGLSTVFGALF